jgi:putative ABC transport system permease protein
MYKEIKLLLIAIKNLSRQKRRSMLSILSVAFSVGVLFFFLGYYRGTYIYMMREAFIKYESGHIQIHTKFFDEKKYQDYIKEKNLIKNYSEVCQKIKSLPQVVEVLPRIITFGFFSNTKEKMPITIIGCISENEKKSYIVAQSIKEGRFLEKQNDGVVIGKKLAELFNLKVGDICFLQTQTIYNTPNVISLPVVGIYETGSYKIDKNTVFTTLDNINMLCDTEDSVNKIIVFLKNMNVVKKTEKELRTILDENLDIKTWEYYGQALLENEQGDSIFYAIFLGILILISISTIIATMYMNVYERTKEVATLRALGFYKSEVFKLFIYEGLAIGIIGGILGIILGGIPNFYLYFWGIDYSGMSEVINIPIFKIISKPAFGDVFVSIFLGLISSYLGTFFPSRRAVKLIISDALRTN